MAATIDQLDKELQGLVSEVPSFATNCFSVVSLEDMEQVVTEMQRPPAAGVGYVGARPISNAGTAVESRSHSVTMVEAQFLIIVAVQYKNAGQVDNKKQATDLLDDLRNKVNGYKGVNSRVWRFGGEQAESELSVDGLAFYSQVWLTFLPFSGSFNAQ
jgi:hypothetical protein